MIAMAVSLLFVFVLIPIDSSAELSTIEMDAGNLKGDADIEVKIFSSFEEDLSNYQSIANLQSNVEFCECLDAVSQNEMVIIDQKWASKQDNVTIKNDVRRCIENNNAVVIVSDSPQILIDSRGPIDFRSYMEDCQVYGIYSMQDGTECCYSVGGFRTTEEAISAVYDLVSEDMYATSEGANITFIGNWGTQKLSKFTYDCITTSGTDYGKFNIVTAYFPIIENDPDYNYYLTSYFFQSVPSDSYRTADMAITTDVDAIENYGQYQELIRYAPTATSGTSSVNIGLGINITESGVSINASASWSYTTPDVSILDESDMEYNIMDLRHNVPEDKNAGIGNYTIQPGNLVMVSTQGDGAYHAEEGYRGSICHHVLGNIFNRFQEFGVTAQTIVPPQ